MTFLIQLHSYGYFCQVVAIGVGLISLERNSWDNLFLTFNSPSDAFSLPKSIKAASVRWITSMASWQTDKTNGDGIDVVELMESGYGVTSKTLYVNWKYLQKLQLDRKNLILKLLNRISWTCPILWLFQCSIICWSQLYSKDRITALVKSLEL